MTPHPNTEPFCILEILIKGRYVFELIKIFINLENMFMVYTGCIPGICIGEVYISQVYTWCWALISYISFQWRWKLKSSCCQAKFLSCKHNMINCSPMGMKHQFIATLKSEDSEEKGNCNWEAQTNELNPKFVQYQHRYSFKIYPNSI